MAHQRTFEGLFEDFEEHVRTIQAYKGPLLPEQEETPVEGPIFAQLSEKNMLEKATNCSPAQLKDLTMAMQPYLARTAKRGPKPKSPPIDSLICYLSWLKLGV